MSAGARRLEGACGSFAPLAGAALYADAPSLVALADALEDSVEATLELAEPPPERVELAPIAQLRVQRVTSGSLIITSDQTDIAFRGGEQALALLAQTLRNLAQTPMARSDRAQPHVDLEYFTGHAFLAEESMWVSVYLVGSPIDGR